MVGFLLKRGSIPNRPPPLPPPHPPPTHTSFPPPTRIHTYTRARVGRLVVLVADGHLQSCEARGIPGPWVREALEQHGRQGLVPVPRRQVQRGGPMQPGLGAHLSKQKPEFSRFLEFSSQVNLNFGWCNSLAEWRSIGTLTDNGPNCGYLTFVCPRFDGPPPPGRPAVARRLPPGSAPGVSRLVRVLF